MICQTTVNITGRNTSGMWQHLKRSHVTVHNQLKKQKDIAPKTAKTDTRILSIRVKPAPISKQICNKFCLRRLASLYIVDEPYFRSMISATDQKYQIPTRKTVSDNLLDMQYKEVGANFKSILEKLPQNHQIAITTDGWSSTDKNKSKYNSLNCQFFYSS